MGRRRYIPTLPHWNDMYVRNFALPYWTPEAKVPIERIRIDRSRLAYDNVVSMSEVARIVANFEQELWMPVTVDKEYYLLDGQHRLEVARRLGLRYIDIIIENMDLSYRGRERS